MNVDKIIEQIKNRRSNGRNINRKHIHQQISEIRTKMVGLSLQPKVDLQKHKELLKQLEIAKAQLKGANQNT